mgnify:CR=1 FL=1
MTTIQWVRVRREDKGSARLVECAVERIRAFVAHFGEGGDGETLATTVWTHYATASPSMNLMVGVESEAPDRVVAHGLAFVQLWNGEPVAWCLQIESDRPMDRASRVAFHVGLDEWVRDYNATAPVKIGRAMLSTPHNEAVYVRWTGWRRYRTLLDRLVAKG